MKQLSLTFVACLALILVSGCNPAANSDKRPLAFSLANQTVAHLHWIGKNQLATDTNAAPLLRMFNEPESAALKAQLIARLATAPWRLIPGVATTNAAAAPLLQPLIEDCLDRESYLEVRAPTNAPGELAFAIQLPADRAGLWQSNLAVVVESLTGAKPAVSPAWHAQIASRHLELARVGEWLILGWGGQPNLLHGDFVARILKNQTPLPSPSEFWLDTDIDLVKVSDAFQLGWKIPAHLAKITLQTDGDGQNIQSRGALDFAQPLALKLEPWQVPTNLIRGDVDNFTAIRGFGPGLNASPDWAKLALGTAPNQFFIWSGYGVPMQTLFAAPVADATNRLSEITNTLMHTVQPWLETNRSGRLELSEETQAINWVGMPFLGPYLRSQPGYIQGGFFPAPFGKPGPHPDILFQMSRTNLIYYDWELTGPRVEAWLYIGQTLRAVLHKSQLPAGVPMNWLLAKTNLPGRCLTTAIQSEPAQIRFIRQSSSVCLTAFELHILADWLASPDFPAGLNTTRGIPELFGVRRGTRAKPAPAPAVSPAN